MASIRRKKSSAHWFACFQFPDGRRAQRSTGTSDPRKALKIAFDLEAAAKKAREGGLVEGQARRIIGDILETVGQGRPHFHSAEEWVREWVAGKAGSTAERSIVRYRQVAGQFLDHLGKRKALPLGAISPGDIRAYRDRLQSDGLSPRACNQAVKIVAAIFAPAQRAGYIEINPAGALPPLRDRQGAGGREAFSAQQVNALLDAAPSDDWRGLVLTSALTGLRLTDAANLAWGNVADDLSAIGLTVRKTGRKQTVALHPKLAAWLAGRPRGVGLAPVFPSLAGKSGAGKSGLSQQFKVIMKAAGILAGVAREGKGRGRTTSLLSFHSLRHFYVTELANKGVAPDIRQKLAGHLDAKSHAVYSHHDLETMREAVSRIAL